MTVVAGGHGVSRLAGGEQNVLEGWTTAMPFGRTGADGTVVATYRPHHPHTRPTPVAWWLSRLNTYAAAYRPAPITRSYPTCAGVLVATW